MNEQGFSLETTTVVVPNVTPTSIAPYRIALIGECPCEADIENLQPFTGPSGGFLDVMLSNCGISRASCFVGNIAQVRPPNNEIFHFKWDGIEIQSGLNQLRKDLQAYQPNLCVLMGKTAITAALGRAVEPSDYRGSLFKCDRIDSPFYGFKFLCTVHPAYVLRDYSVMPLFAFDLKRAREEGEYPDLRVPLRNLLIHLTADEIINRLDAITEHHEVSIDIEGTIETGMSCLAISIDPLESFCIVFGRYSIDEEARIYRALNRVFRDPTIGKCLQYGLYDRMVLAYRYGLLIRGVTNDTLVKSWEIHSELPKGLGTLGSIWTKEPYYKGDRKSDSREVFHQYNCKDSAMTLEISRAMDGSLSGKPLEHYHFNMALQDPLLYMQLQGWNFDKALADQKSLEIKLAKSECLARITTHIGMPLNPNSPKQVAHLLYDLKGLPKQFKKKNGRNTTSVTTDTGALLTLGKDHRDPVLFEILLYRKLGKLEDVTHAQLDKDGRMRCSYNLVGTVTGRISCSTSATGSGFNLQTVTKKLRCLFRADPGYHLFQCDLSGADGWTVAAHCLNQGDSTMWDDYRFGLKPAKIVAAMKEFGREVNQCSREELAKICKNVDQDGWLYFGCKRVQHGTNYSLGKLTMASQIMKDSYKFLGKPIYMDPNMCLQLQGLYLSRYPGVPLWQNWVKRQVLEKGQMTSASGHIRKLFGRRRNGRDVDHETYREALAEEPQANTTEVTNIALYKLWNDMENRRGNTFRIKPVHQVHDALIGQFLIEETDWAIPKIKSYFNNPITIANTTLVIPFEMGVGPSWGDLTGVNI